MIKIFGSRGKGKTTKLIKISSEKQIPILVASQETKYRIMEKAHILGYPIPAPIVFKVENRNIEEVLVDDVEIVLGGILRGFNYSLKGMTINIKDMGDEVYEL